MTIFDLEKDDLLRLTDTQLQPRSGWSGSEADTMQPRANAIKALLSYPDAAIAKAAETVVFETTKWIERIRQREQQRDEEREQKFE